jgi:hypothetical protein
MKNVSTFSLINKEIKLVINQKYLESVKTIVNLAPQEAQWFNTVNVTTNDNYIYLNLGDQLYIPEQYCSAAEVDTDSQMMVSFYKELMQDHSLEETNSIIQSMTCWSHSHHNMGVSPSLQDVNQFNSFIQSALDQGQDTWQVMLIFNKQNEFYSRVYDPTTKNIYEGVSFIQTSDFDLSYIQEAAKTKFKKKTYSFKNSKSSLLNKSGFNYPSWYTEDKYSHTTSDTYINLDVSEHIIKDLFPRKRKLSTIKTNSTKAEEYYETLSGHLDEQEMLWLFFSLNDNKHLLSKMFDPDSVEYYLNSNKSFNLKKEFKNYFLKTNHTVNDFSKYLMFVLNLTDKRTLKDFLSYLGT